MTVKINLKKAQRTTMPDGDYALDIVDAQVVDTQDGESQNIKLKLVPNEAQHPAEAAANVRITDYRSLKEESWFRVVELLRAAGIIDQATHDKLVETGEDYEFEEDDLVGKTVGAAVYVDDSFDPDHPSNKVSQYFPYEGAAEEAEAPAPVAKGKARK